MVRVKKISWGSVEISDGNSYKDCVVRYDGSSEWNWGDDGTRHKPGITLLALDKVIDCDVIILTIGMHGVLNVMPEVVHKLQGRDYHFMLSPDAVALYNMRITKGDKVGMLLHSTC